MAKIMIPLSLERDNPLLYKLACMTQNQRQADRYITIAYPDWSWGETGETHKGIRGDIQAAGSYSLEHCQGGSLYHPPTKPHGLRERRIGVDTRIAGAVVEIEEVFRTTIPLVYPDGTRRLAGKLGGMWLP